MDAHLLKLLLIERLKELGLMALKITALMLILLVSTGCLQSGGKSSRTIVDELDPDPKLCQAEPVIVQDVSCDASQSSSDITNMISSVTGTLHSSSAYDISNIIDGDPNSFWTTPEVPTCARAEIVIEFSSLVNVSGLDLFEDYTSEYYDVEKLKLGNAIISVSTDSTNGLDGSWRTLNNINEDNTPKISGLAQVNTNGCDVKFMRIDMVNDGTGGHGDTPSFYLSELTIYGN